MLYINLMVTTSQKATKDIQRTKRKEPKQNTYTANHKGRGQEKKKGTEGNYRNSLKQQRTPQHTTLEADLIHQLLNNFQGPQLRIEANKLFFLEVTHWRLNPV